MSIFKKMQLNSESTEKTLEIGKNLAPYLEKGDIVCLFGQLGSGKTVLTRGISLGLGAKKDGVSSPSFVLMRQYPARIPVYHFDLYRLNATSDILGLGYEEFFYDQGVCIIEWAERLGFLLPEDCLKIELLIQGENQRLLKFSAVSSHYKKITQELHAHFSR